MREQINFLIVSTRRVGSTALSLRLNDSSNVSCSGEIIFDGKHHPRIRQKHLLVGVEDDLNNFIPKAQTRVCGSKMTIPDYQSSDIYDICNLIVRGGIKVIHLTRNLLEQFVSLKLAQSSGVWHVKHKFGSHIPEWVEAADSPVNYRPLSSDLVEIERFCQNVIEIDKKVAAVQNDVPYLLVDYQNVNYAPTLELVRQFLDLDSIQSERGRLQKTTEGHIKYIQHIKGALEIFESYEQNRH